MEKGGIKEVEASGVKGGVGVVCGGGENVSFRMSFSKDFFEASGLWVEGSGGGV